MKPTEIASATLTFTVAAFVGLLGWMTYRTFKVTMLDEEWRRFISEHAELGGIE